MTSEHEGLLMVALESAALGTPMYAFRVGGLSEVVGASAFGALAAATGVSVAPALGAFEIESAAARYAEVYLAACPGTSR